MELIKFEDFIKINHNKVAACIGQFDGIHIAHQVLINKTIELGDKYNLTKAIISFEPHPQIVLNPEGKFFILTPLEEKVRLLSKYDLDYLVIIPFSLDVAHTAPINFVRDYLEKMNIKELVTGFDFTYGDKGKGKPVDIKDYSNNMMNVTIIDEVKYQSEKIGSTKIRQCLVNGEIDSIRELFGHYYSFYGQVIHGNNIGHKLGVPTANLKVDPYFVPLKGGVYSVNVFIDNKKYRGILNKGHNPSFNFVENESIEVFIIDCNEILYDQVIRIELLEYLRPEIKFDSVKLFQEQIEYDKAKAINFIEK